MEIDKRLVRNNVPDSIEKNGEFKVITRRLNDEEYRKELKKILVDNIDAYLKNDNISNLVESVEIIYSIANLNNIKPHYFDSLIEKELESKGDYSNRTYIEKIEKEDRFIKDFKEVILKCDYNNTYKFAWSKALIELALENNEETNEIVIDFKSISEKMLKYYWNQTSMYNLVQGKNKERPLIIQHIKELISDYSYSYRVPESVSYESAIDTLKKEMYKEYNKCIEDISSTLKSDVSYRFLNVNGMEKKLYKYESRDNKLIITKAHIESLAKHSEELYRIINYRWATIVDNLSRIPKNTSNVILNSIDDVKDQYQYKELFEKYNFNYVEKPKTSISENGEIEIILDVPEKEVSKVDNKIIKREKNVDNIQEKYNAVKTIEEKNVAKKNTSNIVMGQNKKTHSWGNVKSYKPFSSTPKDKKFKFYHTLDDDNNEMYYYIYDFDIPKISEMGENYKHAFPSTELARKLLSAKEDEYIELTENNVKFQLLVDDIQSVSILKADIPEDNPDTFEFTTNNNGLYEPKI